MRTSRLWQISLSVTGPIEDLATSALEQVTGASAASYTNARTGRTVVSVYLPELPGGSAVGLTATLRAELRARGAPATVPLRIRQLRPTDWAEAWKRHFRPLMLGRSLLIKPEWSRRRAQPGQRVLVLNPGLSFGTGQHPTTRYCLREGICLIRRLRGTRPLGVLDLGTGSGILALAAAKLGCAPVDALDADPIAVRVARANARANGLEGKVRFWCADLRHLPEESARRRYDLVFANLQTDLLLAAARAITTRIKPGGHLLVAGVLTREFAMVRRVYEQHGLRRLAGAQSGEWRSGTFVRDARDGPAKKFECRALGMVYTGRQLEAADAILLER